MLPAVGGLPGRGAASPALLLPGSALFPQGLSCADSYSILLRPALEAGAIAGIAGLHSSPQLSFQHLERGFQQTDAPEICGVKLLCQEGREDRERT